MKIFAQKTVVLALIAAGVLVNSLATAAVSVNNVANSKHNFTFTATDNTSFHDSLNVQSQVCVYCHTPHNAGQNRLLWNKARNAVPNFRLYTSSGTLTSITRASALSNNSPSLLCLSCHDGKTAMNVLHASGKGTAAPGDYPAGSRYAFGNAPIYMPGSVTDGFGNITQSPNLGGPGNGSASSSGDDLTNDHPIGFNYDKAQQEKGTALFAISLVDSRIKFFGTDKKVECTTCHDPHVDNQNNPTLNPFLVMSNSNSALCLACHNK